VLSYGDVPARLRGNALVAKGDWHKRRGEFSLAAEAARELTKLRRAASDWALVGEMEQKIGHQEASVAAIEKAVEIDPMRDDLRRALIDFYRREGNVEKTRWHEERMP
jgi:predicted TPR repeat methyltransferase